MHGSCCLRLGKRHPHDKFGTAGARGGEGGPVLGVSVNHQNCVFYLMVAFFHRGLCWCWTASSSEWIQIIKGQLLHRARRRMARNQRGILLKYSETWKTGKQENMTDSAGSAHMDSRGFQWNPMKSLSRTTDIQYSSILIFRDILIFS